MAEAHAERRLAAILAADVVGYTRLVEQAETATLAALKALRQQVIDPLLAEHKGRIVKLMGEAPHPCSSWPRGCACGSPPP
jgi:adenylate cyclase